VASISNGVKIASGCVIGAGAVVLDSINVKNSVVLGMPAKAIKENDGWLREI
jgi:acetyltransferase-like isoleucine patch superfamily enzyme